MGKFLSISIGRYIFIVFVVFLTTAVLNCFALNNSDNISMNNSVSRYSNNHTLPFFDNFSNNLSSNLSRLDYDYLTTLFKLYLNKTINFSELNSTEIHSVLNQSNFSVNQSFNFSDDFGLYYELDDSVIDYPIGNDTIDENNQTPLYGNIIPIIDNETNLTNYYVELGDPLSNETLVNDSIPTYEDPNILIEFSDLIQSSIIVDVPIYSYQFVTINNTNNFSSSVNLNLWNYVKKHLQSSQSIQILHEGEIISEEPFLYSAFESKQSKEFMLIYEYPAIKKEIECESQSLLDILPKDSKIISSDLSVNTIIADKCHLRIYYQGNIDSFDISLNLDAFNINNVKSIYYNEGREFLPIDNEIIKLPPIKKEVIN